MTPFSFRHKNVTPEILSIAINFFLCILQPLNHVTLVYKSLSVLYREIARVLVVPEEILQYKIFQVCIVHQ